MEKGKKTAEAREVRPNTTSVGAKRLMAGFRAVLRSRGRMNREEYVADFRSEMAFEQKRDRREPGAR